MHPNPRPPTFPVQRSSELIDVGLGTGVHGEEGHRGEESIGGANVDDDPASSLLHSLEHMGSQEGGGDGVDGDEVDIERWFGLIQEFWVIVGHAGVVDENADVEALGDGRKTVKGGDVDLGEIGCKGAHLDVVFGGEFLGEIVEARLGARNDDQIEACVYEVG